MAEFTVEFARGSLPPPTYESSSKQEYVPCGDDLHARTILFNNTSADFNLGKNFTSNYPPEAYIRFEDFTDVAEIEETIGGTITYPPSFIPSKLKDINTNQLLVFPHTIQVSELANIGFEHYVGEMDFCNSSKFENRRTRTIFYMVSDSNNLYGNIESAKLVTIGTS